MATTIKDLDGNWQEIATAPNLSERREGSVRLHYGPAAPAADAEAYHVLGDETGSSLSYGGAEKTYARAHGATARLVVTETA